MAIVYSHMTCWINTSHVTKLTREKREQKNFCSFSFVFHEQQKYNTTINERQKTLHTNTPSKE